jgi:KaiC/GvpD/RAD55 family RecA-like ATPase
MRSEIVPIGSLEAKAPDWLLEGYFVRGGINLVVGAKGVGKTTFGCWLGARASVGDEHFGGKKLHVFIDSLEDDPEIVLRPRIEAAGAEMALIDTRKPGSRAWKFPRDIDLLAEYLAAQAKAGTPVDVVILDSLSAYIPQFTVAGKADETLERLTHILQRYRCALIFIHHFNKSGRTIDSAIGGAGGVKRISRTVFIFGQEPESLSLLDRLARLEREDESDGQALILACDKLNLAAKPPALWFLSTAVEIPSVESVHRLELVGETDCTAQAVFEQLRLPPKDEAVQTEIETAINWLLDYLKDGPRPSRRMIADAKLDGVSGRTLERARAQLKCRSIPPSRVAEFLNGEAYQALTDQERRVWWIALPAIPDAPPEAWSK